NSPWSYYQLVMSETVYNKDFYEDQQDGSLQSAREVWPVVFKYVRPASVIDIGCGVGTWLKALEEYKVGNYLGVDGDYVKSAERQIWQQKFVAQDFTRFFQAPAKVDRANSLEVGGHLLQDSADELVKSLSAASDVVLFSAVLPGQTGTYHINEQWP